MNNILLKIKTSCIIIAILFFAAKSVAQYPDTCKVGIYVQSIYDIDYLHNSFASNFWVWTLSHSDTANALKSLEISNAKAQVFESISTEKKDGWTWGNQRCRAVVLHNWDIRDFPFDHQHLTIVLEDANHDRNTLVYIPDSLNSKISESLKIEGWGISQLTLKQSDRSYETSYGDPTIKNAKSVYPAVIAEIDLQRNGLGLFFKLFTGIYVAFAIAMMVFFFDPSHETRYSLSVGAMFAAVANKYIVDSLLPATLGFTLVDQVHAFTFVVILITIVLSIIEKHLHKIGKQKVAKKVNVFGFIGLLISYIIANMYYINKAL